MLTFIKNLIPKDMINYIIRLRPTLTLAVVVAIHGGKNPHGTGRKDTLGSNVAIGGTYADTCRMKIHPNRHALGPQPA